MLAAKEVSPWHEIPLFAGDGMLHYICEIPKETSAKMEVATVRAGQAVNLRLPLAPRLPPAPLTRMPPALQLAPNQLWWCSYAQDEPSTPIKQDVKKGKLRFYPYNINWNYGLLPQTWEDPGVTHPDLKAAVGWLRCGPGCGGSGSGLRLRARAPPHYKPRMPPKGAELAPAWRSSRAPSQAPAHRCT